MDFTASGSSTPRSRVHAANAKSPTRTTRGGNRTSPSATQCEKALAPTVSSAGDHPTLRKAVHPWNTQFPSSRSLRGSSADSSETHPANA